MAFRRVISYFFMLMLVACQNEDGTTNIINVKDEVEINLSQKPTGSKVSPSFIISTIDSVSCTNSELVVKSQLENQTYKLDVLGVWVFGTCVTGKMIPVTDTYFSAETNEYILQLTLKNSIISRGKLTISDDQICVNMDKTTGISLENQCINRISAGGVWGYIASHNVQQSAMINTFITQNADPSFNPVFGNYGLFTLESGQTIRLYKAALPESDKGQLTQRYFKVADWASFTQKLDQFLGGLSDYSIKLTNYEGKVFER